MKCELHKQTLTAVLVAVVLGVAAVLTVLTVAHSTYAAATKLERPVNLKVEDAQTNNPKLRWSKVKKAEWYNVQIRTAKGKVIKKWNRIAKPAKRFKRTVLPQVKAYTFRVRACPAKNITVRTCSRWSKNKLLPAPGNGTPEEDDNEADFIIKNLVVDFADWNTETNMAGAFVFTPELSKVFLEFGATVVGPDGPKMLPTFEYIVDEAAPVYSPIDGIINAVEYQEETQDYEIHINPTEDINQMTIVLDHVLNVQVTAGQSVTAGDVVGTPGTHSAEGLGRVEIEVFGDGNMHCPFKFFDSATQSAYEEKVWELMRDWEEFTGNEDAYDQAAMEEFAAGCLAWEYKQ